MFRWNQFNDDNQWLYTQNSLLSYCFNWSTTEENEDKSTNIWIKPGYALVLFDGEESAKDAISKFNGNSLKRILIVDLNFEN